jgi:hypothetical protein
MHLLVQIKIVNNKNARYVHKNKNKIISNKKNNDHVYNPIKFEKFNWITTNVFHIM